jgi:hypothetical protein
MFEVKIWEILVLVSENDMSVKEAHQKIINLIQQQNQKL